MLILTKQQHRNVLYNYSKDFLLYLIDTCKKVYLNSIDFTSSDLDKTISKLSILTRDVAFEIRFTFQFSGNFWGILECTKHSSKLILTIFCDLNVNVNIITGKLKLVVVAYSSWSTLFLTYLHQKSG